jgi:hypothetical protein
VDILNPANTVVQTMKEESFGDRVLDLSMPGDYMVCFNNKNSFASKVIDFDITVSAEEDWGKGQAAGTGPSKTLSQFEKALSSLKSELRTMQTYETIFAGHGFFFRTLDMRDISRVETLEIPPPSKRPKN